VASTFPTSSRGSYPSISEHNIDLFPTPTTSTPTDIIRNREPHGRLRRSCYPSSPLPPAGLPRRSYRHPPGVADLVERLSVVRVATSKATLCPPEKLNVLCRPISVTTCGNAWQPVVLQCRNPWLSSRTRHTAPKTK